MIAVPRSTKMRPVSDEQRMHREHAPGGGHGCRRYGDEASRSCCFCAKTYCRAHVGTVDLGKSWISARFRSIAENWR